MSIYKHYKGGLHLVKAYTTPLPRELYDREKITTEIVAQARHKSTLEMVDIVKVYDLDVKSHYYTHDSEKHEDVMVFYCDTYGRHWLRSRESFFEEVVYMNDKGEKFSEPRFKTASNAFLFETILVLFDRLSSENI